MVSMATRVMQSDSNPPNGHFYFEINIVIYLLTNNLDFQLEYKYGITLQAHFDFLLWISSSI